MSGWETKRDTHSMDEEKRDINDEEKGERKEWGFLPHIMINT